MNTDLLLSTIVAAAERPAGGSSVRDIVILGGIMNVVIGLWIWLIAAYRSGGARWLRRLSALSERVTGIPGWAMVPGLASIGAALITIFGATWDIGLHIDIGRDDGPFGTFAHYPMLIGLEAMFLIGILAVVMAPEAPEQPSPASMTILGWTVPAGAVLLTAAGGFSLLGFPLDDLWHRTFGQDVTLWGPTHTMFIGGVVAAGCGGVLLMIEGARVAGIDPFRGRLAQRLPLGPLLAGIWLYFFTAVLHEFNWGVPQYRAVWQPYFLALGGAFALVLARQLCGRFGAIRAVLVWLPVQVGMTVVIGGAFDVTPPAMPLFVAQALLIEALGWRGTWRRPVRFAVAAGLLVGTVGFAADYAWTQVGMPLPWQPGLIAEGLPVAIGAALSGALLGSLAAGALLGRLPRFERPGALTAGAVVLALGLAANNVASSVPDDVTATITVTGVRTAAVGHQDTRARVGDVTVRLSRPELARDGNWAYLLAWQGGGRVVAGLKDVGGGVLRSTAPVPIDGDWKSFLRLQKGRVQLAAPVRMPADPVLAFAGYPAPVAGPADRTMLRDTTLLQIERKKDGPLWAWKPAFLAVIAADLSLLVLMGIICVRLGRLAPDAEAPGGGAVRGASAPPVAATAVPAT